MPPKEVYGFRPLPYGALYCFACCAETAGGNRPNPNPAVTLWPSSQVIQGPGGIPQGFGLVALPACGDHLQGVTTNDDTPPAIAEVEDTAINQDGILRPGNTGLAVATSTDPTELRKFRGGIR